MGYSYDKLWKLLIDKKINKEQLRERTGLSSTTIARMSKDENVSLTVLAKICSELNCDISTEWGSANEYKEWKYLFIPAGQIKISSSFMNLAMRFDRGI